ncbi:hypothetical protein BG015_007708 [Linnemannia schmuckeri]|uniref:Uncharacterized protein n=1 Tax=Linnemannia schmuckeri TaxID=64567 RepID=A0A9P5VAP7_9FUNG|nr:hypothetical protein BG015_007708 [Linnemannia schmuckeri]
MPTNTRDPATGEGTQTPEGSAGTQDLDLYADWMAMRNKFLEHAGVRKELSIEDKAAAKFEELKQLGMRLDYIKADIWLLEFALK